MTEHIRSNGERLLASIAALGAIGALEGGGVSRLALSGADGRARDHIVETMRALDLEVRIDAIGNIFGIYPGKEDLPPVMMGSHIDTVAAAGLYDGNYGVLSGLEAIAAFKERGARFRRPLAVAVFTNEEGVRFHPDMLGSLVFAGGYPLEKALASADGDGVSVGEALSRIGYAGTEKPGFPVDAYVELHIEQGPVLDREGIQIGAVLGVQGISWSEISLGGVANHAGTTPMAARHDAGYVAAKIIAHAYEMAVRMGGQTATAGRMTEYKPGMVNVIPDRVTFTLDLRNYNEEALRRAENELWTYAGELAGQYGVTYDRKSLARFEPVAFAEDIVSLVEKQAEAMGFTWRRMPSGAGHDAQMLARVCPTGMIFVPNRDGISHSVREHAEPEALVTGCNVLLGVVAALADRA